MRALGLATYEAVGILEVLWCNAEEHYSDGALRGCDETDIADMVGWRGEPGQLVDALVTTGWLDRADDGTLLIHDWPDHCADHIHMRLARNNQRFADGREPRTGRLPRAQRAHAERTVSAHERTVSAHERTVSAHERTASAHERTASAHERTTQDPRPKTQDHTSGERELPYTPLTPHETSPPPLVPVENSVEILPEPRQASKAPGAESPPLAQTETASRQDSSGQAGDQPSTHESHSGSSASIVLGPNLRKISKTDTGLQRVGDFAVDVTRRMLRDWMERHADRLPPPDDEICRRLLVAHGMSLDRLRDWLLWLRRRGKRPEAVQSWGWFAHLAEAEAARDGPVLEPQAAAGGAA